MNEISSFETALGSVYTYDPSGRVLRQKSALGSTMEASTSSFDRTVFVSPQDRGAVEAGYQRGLKPLEDGTLQGLDYNRDKLDNVKFSELRKKGVSFDEAYTSSGGTITPRNITPELQPKMGYNPFEYNLGNNKYHVGSEVTKINKAAAPIASSVTPKLGHHSPEEIAGRHPSHRKPQPKTVTKRIDPTPPESVKTTEPVTKRIGPTPPDSGTTLVDVGRTGRLKTSATTAAKMEAGAKRTIAEFTSDPEELYRKFLGHFGDIKSEGGILDERLGPGARNLDPNDIRVAAINRLGMETGLVEDAGKYDPHNAISKIKETLEKNKTFVDQTILDENTVSGRNVVVGGRSLKDLQKENPGKSIDELIEINKRQQIDIMTPKSATVVDSTKPLSVGTSTDLPTETKPIVPKADSSATTTKATTTTTTSSTPGPGLRSTSGVVEDAINKTKSSSTTRKVVESLDAAKNAVKGKANARNLLLAGAASIVGVGLYKRNRETRIEPDEQYY